MILPLVGTVTTGALAGLGAAAASVAGASDTAALDSAASGKLALAGWGD